MKRIISLTLTAACATPLMAFAQSSGQQTYSQACSTCHDTGTSGAPMISDKGAWQSRIQQGKKVLYQHAINGIGAMPPKGGFANLSDKDVEAAVDYMVAQVSGGGGGGQQAAKSSGGGGKQAKSSGGGGGAPSPAQILKSAGSALQIMPVPTQVKNPYSGDKNAIATGETLFNSMNCSGCHAPEAGGGMGPALTDIAWIYGDSPADLYITISNGRPNGMPAYGNTLPPESIWNLVSYIETLAPGPSVSTAKTTAKK